MFDRLVAFHNENPGIVIVLWTGIILLILGTVGITARRYMAARLCIQQKEEYSLKAFTNCKSGFRKKCTRYVTLLKGLRC